MKEVLSNLKNSNYKGYMPQRKKRKNSLIILLMTINGVLPSVKLLYEKNLYSHIF